MRRPGSSRGRFTTNAAPRRFHRRGAAQTEGSVAGVVRQQVGIKVDLALRDRPTLLVVLDGLHAPRIRVVVVQAVSPVALILRVATHQVKPTLRLVRQLQVTFAEDRVAHRRLVQGTGIIGRAGAILGAGTVSGPGADHVDVLDRDPRVAELVLRLGVDEQRLGVAVQRDVHVALAAIRTVVRGTVFPRQRPVLERGDAEAVPAAAAAAVAGLLAIISRRILVVVPVGRMPGAPTAAGGEAEVPREVEIDDEARAAAGVHAGGGDVEDHLAIALIAREERADVIGAQPPVAGIDDLLGPVVSVWPLGRAT